MKLLQITALALIAAFAQGCAKTLPDVPNGWAASVVKAPDKAPPQCSEWPAVPQPLGTSGRQLVRYSDQLLNTVGEYQRVHGACAAWATRR